LPSGALLTVRLVDISRADAAATILGEQIMQVDGRQPPFGFAIPYDPTGIDERHTYSVQARIEVDGKLRFISDQFYPVITRGAARQVDLVLKAVGNSKP
jgi:putative lipoprotein